MTFDLVWVATTGIGTTGTTAIFAAPGDILTLAINMTTNQTLAGHSVSINFDTDFGNELDLFRPHGGANWNGKLFGAPGQTTDYSPTSPVGYPPGLPSIESSGANAGRINSFNSSIVAGPLFLPAGTYLIGTARFVANVAVNDGPDVFVGLFNTGADRVLDNLNQVIPASSLVFRSATLVGYIPEPGTASLVGLGLVALVLAGRASRRSGRRGAGG